MSNQSHPFVHETHPVAELRVFASVQRKFVPAWGKKLSAELDLDALGSFIVNRRTGQAWEQHPAAGKLSLVDGQHRRWALIDQGLGEWEVDCKVYEGFAEEDEARLFRIHNHSRKPHPVDDFITGVTEGDQECVIPNRIAERCGLRVAHYKAAGTIACVNELRSIYRGLTPHGKNTQTCPSELEATLITLRDAWGLVPQAFEGLLVAGLGRVFLRYNGEIDREALVTRLAKFPGGPQAFIGRAKGMAGLSSSTSARKAVAQLAVDVYNTQRHNKLGRL